MVCLPHFLPKAQIVAYHCLKIKKSNAKFVKSIAIYGANASGKSNLLKSLEFFRYFTTEFRSHSEESIKIPQIVEFLLNEETRNKPSFFEIEIIIADELYIYGFKVSRERVAEEWLHKKKGKKNFFTRKKQKIELARDFEKHGKDLIKKTREDALFLNILAQSIPIILTEVASPVTCFESVKSSFLNSTREFGSRSDLFIVVQLANVRTSIEKVKICFMFFGFCEYIKNLSTKIEI